ncbi:beta-lactamase-like protein [Naviculisporaceae sp. PSN 640]
MSKIDKTTANSPSPPDLHIPPSKHTVSVSIINTTSAIRGAKASDFFGPPIEGHEWLAAPVFCFLIQHHEYDDKDLAKPIPGKTRNLLFDLGIRKDWWSSAPLLVECLRTRGSHSTSGETYASSTSNIDPNTIEAIIWSHHHFDHTGDPSVFPSSAALIVGPGVSDALLPGYPDSTNSTLLKSDYEGREVIELNFETGAPTSRFKTLKIGQLSAIDYFGDGSFYLLDTPGHAVGHICALARVTSSSDRRNREMKGPDMGPGPTVPDTFVLLAGDAFHHPGEIRPSRWLKVPETLSVSLAASTGEKMGRRALIGDALPRKHRHQPQGKIGDHKYKWHHNPAQAASTLQKLQEFDAQSNILVLAAHDESLLDLDPDMWYPRGTLDGWFKDRLKDKLHWGFMADFVGAIALGDDTHPDKKEEEGGLEKVPANVGGERGTGSDSLAPTAREPGMSREEQHNLMLLRRRWEMRKDCWGPVGRGGV